MTGGIRFSTGTEYVGQFDENEDIILGAVQNSKFENIGAFKSFKNRNNTTTVSNEEGKTISKNGKVVIGRRSQLCQQFGGPIYVKFPNGDQFYGATTADCGRYDRGIYISKKTGKAHAVKSGKNGFTFIKEVNVSKILRERNLQ